MRILKIVNSNDGGGVYTCERQFIKEFQRQGAAVDLIILGDGPRKEDYIGFGKRYLCLSEIESYSKGNINKIGDLVRTYTAARKKKPEIVKFFAGTKIDAVIYRRQYYNFLAAMLGRHFKSKVYWHMPGVVKTKVLQIMHSLLLLMLDIIPVANSKYTKQTLGSVCKYVVYPGFDPCRSSQPADMTTLRDRLGIPNNSLVYGVASRIYPGKALHLVIQAFAETISNEDNSYLVIAGRVVDQDYWAELLERFSDSFQRNIIYIGEIGDMREFYASIDILINGGQEAEAFGISVAEGIGSARPVIAYGLGGPTEMIQDNQNGWIIETPTVVEYCRAFERSLNSRQRLGEMGIVSKDRSVQFTVERNVKEFLNIIVKENGAAKEI